MLKKLSQYSVVRAAATSCMCMAGGDFLCQRITSREGVTSTDWQRTARFGVVGCTLHGPFFNWGFSALDRMFGRNKDMVTVAKKVATGQLSLFPLYLSTFFVYMALLEGSGLEGGLQKLGACFMPTVATGMLFWPIVNTVNFRFIPPSPGKRMIYINGAGIVWNIVLSWENSKIV